MTSTNPQAHGNNHYRELELEGIQATLGKIGTMKRDELTRIKPVLLNMRQTVQDALALRKLTPEERENWERIAEATNSKLGELEELIETTQKMKAARETDRLREEHLQEMADLVESAIDRLKAEGLTTQEKKELRRSIRVARLHIQKLQELTQ